MIRIITDSTADFSRDEIAALGISVVPLTVSFGANSYRDGIDLPAVTFYRMLAEEKQLPTTSQPSPELFLHHFLEAKAAGDTVLCVLLSSQLSGTCQSAEIAKEEAEYAPIYIVDSLQVTLALGLLVRRAVSLARAGLPVEEIVADLEAARTHIHLLAVVNDLTYLRKGGRLSGAAAVAGGLLGIKPVVRVSEGKLHLAGKARGLPGAYVAIFKMIDALGGIEESEPVVVGYTGHAEGVTPFVRYVQNNLHLQKPMVCPIGTVIGTHAGPGACGIAFFDATLGQNDADIACEAHNT